MVLIMLPLDACGGEFVKGRCVKACCGGRDVMVWDGVINIHVWVEFCRVRWIFGRWSGFLK